MKALKYLNSFLLKYWKKLLIGLVITISARVFSLFMPSYINESIQVIEQYFRNEISQVEAKKMLLIDIGIIVGTTFIAAILTFLMRQYIINVSRYIEYDLKNTIYDHYQVLSSTFYKKNRVGDLMNRISEDVSQVRMYAGPAIMYGLQTFTLFAILIPLMFIKAPELALYTVLPFPLLSFLIYRISRLIHVKSTAVQAYLSTLSTFTQERFSGIAIVKAYHLEQKIDNDMQSLAEEGKHTAMAMAKINAWFFPLMLLLIGISNIIVMYVGGRMYLDGNIQSVGLIAEFILYVNMLTWPVTIVGWLTSIIQRAEASQERINDFLMIQPEIDDSEATTQELRYGQIEFKNVHYTYLDTGIEALQKINFKINSGETVALMGKTGAGKSTIIDLISRLIEPQQGEVLIDGIRLNHYFLSTLRSSMGVVPQDSFLFSDTIENNIRFGKLDATYKEVTNAAKLADVHHNILDFPNEYQTVLGERGISLSGGQKQRVSIARVMIKEPQIFLFDDCLSAVDTETEEVILGNIKNQSKGKTTVIVSHRMATVKHADRVLVFEDGQIVQEGTHNELISIEGFYQDLYREQLNS